jgi:hypothetical protein
MRRLAETPLTVAILVLSVVLVASPAVANVRYIYDDVGRLSQVIDDQGNVATYT